ncbi:MAG: DEAD/DEAH box helicase family protein [Anaeromyxobacteraceae bacterium]
MALEGATEDEKGKVFELLVQHYLQLDSKYDFKNVWSTHGEVPKAVLQKLNLFHRDVTGIDLVAETRTGKFWAVQAKYHHDEKWSLSRQEATGVIAGRNRAHGELELALVATTANSRSAHLAGEPGLEFLMGDVWRGLDAAFFRRLHQQLRGAAPQPPARKKPRRHQREALKGITGYFADHARGKVVMPCATGKSLIGFWAAEKLRARAVLVAVPNLSLIRQLLTDWTEQSLARGRRPAWAVVCSDDSVADSRAAQELGVKVDTDPAEVAAWMLRSRRADLAVVFTTYQSGKVVGAAARKAGMTFDVGVFDEAHRTAGRDGAPFSYLLDDDNIRVRRRIYMTATPRIYKGKDRDDVISMGDPAVYGGEAFKMTFLKAMDRGIIPNLTIVAVTVAQAEVDKLLRDRLFVRLQKENADEVLRVEDLVSALALRKAMKKYGIRRTLGFYSSRKRCHRAAEVQELIGKLFPEYGHLDVFHVDGDMTAAERDTELRAFKESENALITNVRVFVEGVDCPSMDAVIFADPRQSVIDIVQGVGRALRPFPGKEAGFAIIPTIIEEEGTPSDATYGDVVRVTCALGSENEVVLDYFAAVAQGKPWTGRRVFEVAGDVEVGLRVDLDMVNQAIAVRTFERTVQWRAFQPARAFARSLGLTSALEWASYCKSGRKPVDIPVAVTRIYQGEWRGWGDWLGTGNLHEKPFREFQDARKFVRSLGLKSAAGFRALIRARKLPPDIPTAPYRSYDGDWISWADWLGTTTVDRNTFRYRSFREARAFVRRLNLTSQGAWDDFCKSGKKPPDIPAAASRVYKGKGWAGFGDWLGTGFVASRLREYRLFAAARTYSRSLDLAGLAEWKEFCRSGRKPRDIPAGPHNVYREEWRGWGDWLGTGRTSIFMIRPFEEARTFVRGLGLRSANEWRAYCRSGRKPSDIPTAVNACYRDKGWVSWGDFLGTGEVSPSLRKFRDFASARAFVRSLGIPSETAWREYSRSSRRPTDVPAAPNVIYRQDGWVGWGDWLGTGARKWSGGRPKAKRPFIEARAFARSLDLAHAREWRAYCRSGRRPDDIPANPDRRYPGEWESWGDWLGTGNKIGGWRRRR